MTGYGDHLLYINSNGKVGFLRNSTRDTITGLYARGSIYPDNTSRFQLTFTKACQVYRDNNVTGDTLVESFVTATNYNAGDTLTNINGYETILIIPR